jgi:tetratricopeptide (TPR) repeat protein
VTDAPEPPAGPATDPPPADPAELAPDSPPVEASPPAAPDVGPLPPPGPTLGEAIGWWVVLAVGTAAGAAVLLGLAHVLFGGRDDSPARFALVAVASFVTAAGIAVGRYRRRVVRRLALRRPAGLHLVLAALLAAPVAVLGTEISARAAAALGRNAAPVPAPAAGWDEALHKVGEMERGLALGPWWLLLTAGCLLPALGEEAFFRGFLGRGLVANHGPVTGVLLTSGLFALIHVDPVRVAGTFALGAAAHLVYLAARSLWPAVLLHALNNLLAFGSERLAETGSIDLTGQYGADHLPAVTVLAAGAAAAAVSVVFYHTRVRWERPDGTAWDPGFVTAETPPPAEGAAARRRGPGVGVLLVAAAYAVFAAAAGFAANPGTARTAWAAVTRGLAAEQAGDHGAAAEHYTQAIRLDPNYAPAYAARGSIRVRRGQDADALPDLDAAVRLDPNLADAYLNRGVVRHRLGRAGEAMADYDHTIRLDPGGSLAYANRGLLHLNAGDYDRAAADLTAALARGDASADTYGWRGSAQLGRKEYRAAVDDLTEAIRRAPPGRAAWFDLRARAYEAAGDPARADADVREAARLAAEEARPR